MKKVMILGLAGFLAYACTKDNKVDLLAEQPKEQSDSCQTVDMSYQSDIKSILTQNCASSGCHLGPNGVGGLDLSTFTSAQRIAADGEMMGRIKNTNGPLMPPGGKLSDCDIEKIQSWINDGAQNN
jgi:hypothetical protein